MQRLIFSRTSCHKNYAYVSLFINALDVQYLQNKTQQYKVTLFFFLVVQRLADIQRFGCCEQIAKFPIKPSHNPEQGLWHRRLYTIKKIREASYL